MISSTPARVIVHWRNASASTEYKWDGLDENGWGTWTDEYWTIYPDGVSVRHQLVHNQVVSNRTRATINCEMNLNEILHQPGQSTEDVLLDEAVITANTDGETQSWSRSKGGRVLDKNTMEAMNIYGLTHEGPTGLTSLRTLDLDGQRKMHGIRPDAPIARVSERWRSPANRICL